MEKQIEPKQSTPGHVLTPSVSLCELSFHRGGVPMQCISVAGDLSVHSCAKFANDDINCIVNIKICQIFVSSLKLYNCN